MRADKHNERIFSVTVSSKQRRISSPTAVLLPSESRSRKIEDFCMRLSGVLMDKSG
jgi:hypothetical protein